MNPTHPSIPRPRRGHRLRAGAAASVAVVLGLVVGGLAFTSTPANGDVATWEAPTLTTGFTSVGSPFSDVGYGVDGEDFVHLRGQVAAALVPVERTLGAGTGGPWLATAFTIPEEDCALWPDTVVAQSILVSNDETGLEQYEGVVFVHPDGQVVVGGFDLQVLVESGVNVASFVASLDMVEWPADPTPLTPCPTP